jgi:hypothetical protein
MSVGKNLALLQAEESACVLELVNVPNVRWLFALCMKPNLIISAPQVLLSPQISRLSSPYMEQHS